ncbi:MAG TPA: hypothetical protein VGM93_03475 [Acidimicrobiales bacterium]
MQFQIHRQLAPTDAAALDSLNSKVAIEPANLTAGDTMGASPPPWVGFPDAATKATYDAQMQAATDAAQHYASAAAAANDGYVLSSYFISEFGVHWVKWSLVTKPFDPAHPAMLLYDGDGTDAHLVGLSYYTFSAGTAPAGFAGSNDVWHRHFGDCYAGGFVIGEDITDADTCTKIGEARDAGFVHQPVGTPAEAGDIQRYLSSHPGPPEAAPSFDSVLVDGNNEWMLHAWTVPGHPNRLGMFATANPDVQHCVGACRSATT